MLQQYLITEIENILSKYFSNEVEISSVKNLSGGCINEVYCLITGNQSFVLKVNNATTYPGMFEAEAKGLQLLSSTNTLKIPDVFSTGAVGDISYILMEFVEPGRREKSFFKNFGQQLAFMHQHTSEYFGLDHDNYIGSLKQFNKQHSNGVEFFIHQRLMPQLKLAIEEKAIGNETLIQFEKLFSHLPGILPNEKPALIHGDLWSGNYIASSEGNACILDPAVSYSHREADIAMSKLFGGFDRDFYDTYNDTFPMQPDWQNRMDIWNLYPLLVHVNLFGGGYLEQVKSVLRRFS